jgi:hyperosmotically inducible protein
MKSKLLLFISGIALSVGVAVAANQPGMMKSTGQSMTDAAITTKVKSNLLMHKKVPSTAISVTTVNGVVTLKGEVANAALKRTITQVTGKTSGVKSVHDELVIVKAKKS